MHAVLTRHSLLVPLCLSLAGAACQKDGMARTPGSPATETAPATGDRMRDRTNDTTADRDTTRTRDTDTTGNTAANRDSANREADNTRLNERDRNGANPTPMDQGNSQEDVKTTADIRKAVMADDTLSSDAKNAKIITANGVVVLRGAVKSEREKMALEAKATQLAGTNRVENQLDVVAGY